MGASASSSTSPKPKRRFIIDAEYKDAATGQTIQVFSFDLNRNVEEFEPKTNSNECRICKLQIGGVTRWKRHCVGCTLLCCNECAPESVFRVSGNKKVRVCVECLKVLAAKNDPNSQLLSGKKNDQQQQQKVVSATEKQQQQQEEEKEKESATTKEQQKEHEEKEEVVEKEEEEVVISKSSLKNTKKTAYDFVVQDILNRDYPLSIRKGFPTILVNVASKCGLTDEGYGCLTTLFDKYQRFGFSIVAFPCDQFYIPTKARQEFSDASRIINETCSRHKIKFPMMKMIDVNGDDADELFKFLKSEKSGALSVERIAWNFTAFICNGNGEVVHRVGPGLKLNDLEPLITPLLPPAGVEIPSLYPEGSEPPIIISASSSRQPSPITSSANNNENIASATASASAAVVDDNDAAAKQEEEESEQEQSEQQPSHFIEDITQEEELNQILNDVAEDSLLILKGWMHNCGGCSKIAEAYAQCSVKYHRCQENEQHQQEENHDENANKNNNNNSNNVGVKFYALDVDDGDDLATLLNIEQMPLFIFYKNKKEITRFTGPHEEKLIELIEKHK